MYVIATFTGVASLAGAVYIMTVLVASLVDLLRAGSDHFQQPARQSLLIDEAAGH